jgi:hypothetical protein
MDNVASRRHFGHRMEPAARGGLSGGRWRSRTAWVLPATIGPMSAEEHGRALEALTALYLDFLSWADLTFLAIDGLMHDAPGTTVKGRSPDEGRDLYAHLDRGPPALLPRSRSPLADRVRRQPGGWQIVRRLSDQTSGATL